MPEAGGPTAQSGILYQNSIAALYLGRLLDPRSTPNSQRVISVRLEAPEEVDDVVVTYESGTRLLIQAKEALNVGTTPWKDFWTSLKVQHTRSGGAAERYLLAVGTLTSDLDTLRELCDRSQGKDTEAEWTESLAATHGNLLNKIIDSVQIDVIKAFSIMQRLTVQFQTINQIETVGIRDAIPASNVTPESLFSILRDACGGAARVRATFDAVSLVDRLAAVHKVTLIGAPGDGLLSYFAAIESKYRAIVVPGTTFRGQLDDVLIMPTIELVSASELSDFEDESYRRPRGTSGEIFELSGFPRAARKHLLIEAGAGFGKTTVLHTVLLRLAREKVFIPALIVADELSSSSGILNYLDRNLNTNFRINIDWMALCRQGRAVLIVDGLDELADAARTSVINEIEQVAAMFPNVPILVAARDRSALSLPLNFSRCRIWRLSEAQSINLLRCYLVYRPDIKSELVISSLLASKDLAALCSIPLFLALMVVTLPRSGQLPKSRADLLERYLILALTPQRHKTGPQPHTSITNLRRAAEILALNGLRRNTIAQIEDVSRRELGALIGQEPADYCIDDLLQCGLLVRRGTRISFPIATVQEYLAGCALSASEPDVGAWFKQIARRPWAQAVQFALERVSNSEPALVTQIDRADDIFHTSLRIIARSVVNGGQSSPAFKRKLIERLLAAWIRGSWRVRRDIAELLGDGLAIPPTPELIKLLVKTGDQVSHGALLLKLGDRDLALRAFEVLLSKDDIRDLWTASWIDVVKMIGPIAIDVMVGRLAKPGYIVEEVIACVLYRLRNMKTVHWVEIIEQRHLPGRVAAACLWGAERQNTPDGRNMIASLLKDLADEATQKDRPDVRLWIDFPEAYLGTNWWRQHITDIVVGEKFSERERATIFNALIDVRHELASNGIALAEELQRIAINSARGTCLFSALVCAASFGDATLHCQVSATLAERPSLNNFEIWVSWFPYFSEEHKIAGLTIIKNYLRGASDELDFMLNLIHKANHVPSDSRQVSARGPFLISNFESRSRLFVCEWAAEIAAVTHDDNKRLLLISQLVNIGGDGAEMLVEALRSFATRGVLGESDNWLWVFTAITALDQADCQIDIDVVLRLVELFPSFPTNSFFSILMRQRGRAVTERICELFSGADISIRAQILGGLEEVSQSLGVSVSIDSAGSLRLDWVD